MQSYEYDDIINIIRSSSSQTKLRLFDIKRYNLNESPNLKKTLFTLKKKIMVNVSTK